MEDTEINVLITTTKRHPLHPGGVTAISRGLSAAIPASHPGGVAEISRGLSAAIPPVRPASHPGGVAEISRGLSAAIPPVQLKTLQFPLPPLAEQKRIVAKVDRLMALCDALEAQQQARHAVRSRLHATLLGNLQTAANAADFARAWERLRDHFSKLFAPGEAALDAVAQLRQTILQLAVQGKLVPQDADDEPAEALLTEIQAKELDRREAIRSQRAPLTIVAEAEQPFEAFPLWRWARFGQVASISSGVTLGRNLDGKKTAGFPYLRVANVQRNFLNLETVKEVEIPPEELVRYRLEKGDVLMTEGGDWDKLGRAAIWEGQIENCLHQNHIFRSRPLSNGLRPRWITLYMNSPFGQRYFQESSKQTTNLASINMTQLRNSPFPLPPTKMQDRIIEKHDTLMAQCDSLKAILKEAAAVSERCAAAAVRHLLDGAAGPISAR